MREKLILWLLHIGCPDDGCDFCKYGESEHCRAEVTADYLIANGVTIPVRCKDCHKRYNPKECPMCVFVYGEQHDVTHDDGYCDRGERRTDGTD